MHSGMFSTPGHGRASSARTGGHVSELIRRQLRRPCRIARPGSTMTATRKPAEGADGCPGEAELEQVYLAEARQLKWRYQRKLGFHDAEDLVQESFARLLGRPDGLALISRPAAFLNRIARNLWLNGEKASRSRPPLVEYDERIGPDSPDDPVALLEARDLLARVEAAIEKLPPRARNVFVARRIDGLSYAEIAEQQGLSIRGVEKQMGKAIAALDRMVNRR